MEVLLFFLLAFTVPLAVALLVTFAQGWLATGSLSKDPKDRKYYWYGLGLWVIIYILAHILNKW